MRGLTTKVDCWRGQMTEDAISSIKILSSITKISQLLVLSHFQNLTRGLCLLFLILVHGLLIWRLQDITENEWSTSDHSWRLLLVEIRHLLDEQQTQNRWIEMIYLSTFTCLHCEIFEAFSPDNWGDHTATDDRKIIEHDERRAWASSKSVEVVRWFLIFISLAPTADYSLFNAMAFSSNFTRQTFNFPVTREYEIFRSTFSLSTFFFPSLVHLAGLSQLLIYAFQLVNYFCLSMDDGYLAN